MYRDRIDYRVSQRVVYPRSFTDVCKIVTKSDIRILFEDSMVQYYLSHEIFVEFQCLVIRLLTTKNNSDNK